MYLVCGAGLRGIVQLGRQARLKLHSSGRPLQECARLRMTGRQRYALPRHIGHAYSGMSSAEHGVHISESLKLKLRWSIEGPDDAASLGQKGHLNMQVLQAVGLEA